MRKRRSLEISIAITFYSFIDYGFAPIRRSSSALSDPLRSDPSHPIRPLSDPPHPIRPRHEARSSARSASSDPPAPIRPIPTTRSDALAPMRPIRCARSDPPDPMRSIRCARFDPPDPMRSWLSDEASVAVLVERCRGKCAADPPGPVAVQRAATSLAFGRGQQYRDDWRGGGATASSNRMACKRHLPRASTQRVSWPAQRARDEGEMASAHLVHGPTLPPRPSASSHATTRLQ